jgi:hypothetical protein
MKPTTMFETQEKTRNYYSRAMIEDASDYLWKNYGISVGTPEYKWNYDQLIQEAVKKGWKFSFY